MTEYALLAAIVVAGSMHLVRSFGLHVSLSFGGLARALHLPENPR